jgi:parallel beta-helix repeat protein
VSSKGTTAYGRALILAISLTFIFSSLGFLCTSDAIATGPVEVSGIISQDTTWTLDNSPYVVTGNLLVAQDATLTIEAGVEVLFSSDLYLKVEGALNARGNESAWIVFTSDSSSPQMLDWKYIEFSRTSDDENCVLEYCEILYAETGIYIMDASPTISNCIVSNNYDGIVCEGYSEPNINNNTIRYNFLFGIALSDGLANVMDNRILDNGWTGITCGDEQSTPLIYNNTISNSTRGIDSTRGLPHIIHNTITDNEDGIFLHETDCWVWNNTIKENDNGIHITGNGQPNITYNNILDNTDYDVNCENERDIHAPFNYWGTNNTTELQEIIYDYQDDFNFGNFTVLPLLDGPSTGAPNISVPAVVDTDGDGVPDELDAFPNDPSEWKDSDGDGHGDNSDVFPFNPDEWLDTDSDGYGDNSDAFPTDPQEWMDSDKDGLGDNSDVFPTDFPTDPLEWMDSDGDGQGDNSDVFPTDPLEWMDSDGDGHGDNSDVFPNDPEEWLDFDLDDVGNNKDAFPLDKAASLDSDLDGHPDAWNPGMSEDDSDTMLTLDEYPDDPSRWRKEAEDGSDLPVALAVVAIGIITLIGIGATEVGKATIYAILYPSLTRLKREKVLDQFTRGQIYGLIRGNPGINYTKLLETLEIGNGTLAYHLNVLVKEDFIKSRTEGTRKLFYSTRLPAKLKDLEERFPTGEEIDRDHTLSDLQEGIVSLVRENPGISQSEIVSKMDVPKQTVSYNIKNLEKYGIIEVRAEGKTSRCYVK